MADEYALSKAVCPKIAFAVNLRGKQYPGFNEAFRVNPFFNNYFLPII